MITGPLDSASPDGPVPPPPQPADFVVDLVGTLLSSRADAADILAAVAHRLSLPAFTIGMPGEQPGSTLPLTSIRTHAQRADLTAAVRIWHLWAAERHRLLAISSAIRSRGRLKPAFQSPKPGVQPGSSATASPPTVAVLGERSREERDAELRLGALSLSPATSTPTPVASVALTVSPGPVTSPGPCPASLITADAIPPEFQQSPSYSIVGQVLRSHLDFTSRDWRARAFYEPAAVAAYQRWSDPAGQSHRDAAAALAALSDPAVLGVPDELLSSVPNTAAESWDYYRLVWTHELQRAFAAGVDWQRALRAMDLIYSSDLDGHPRIHQYITSAMTDRVLIHHPLLHAEVLRFKLDTSFAAGSKLYSKETRTAEWERTTERLPGEDIVTLATRVAEAYLKKLNDPSLDMVTVWACTWAAREICERFYNCILADPINKERGSRIAYEFDAKLNEIKSLQRRRAALRAQHHHYRR